MICCPVCGTDLGYEVTERYASCRCFRLVMDDRQSFLFSSRVPYDLGRIGRIGSGQRRGAVYGAILLLTEGKLYRIARPDRSTDKLWFMGDRVTGLRISPCSAEFVVMDAIHLGLAGAILET